MLPAYARNSFSAAGYHCYCNASGMRLGSTTEQEGGSGDISNVGRGAGNPAEKLISSWVQKGHSLIYDS
eukprot:5249958-Lingulodinium_polyedra.AAC.1